MQDLSTYRRWYSSNVCSGTPLNACCSLYWSAPTHSSAGSNRLKMVANLLRMFLSLTMTSSSRWVSSVGQSTTRWIPASSTDHLGGAITSMMPSLLLHLIVSLQPSELFHIFPDAGTTSKLTALGILYIIPPQETAKRSILCLGILP